MENLIEKAAQEIGKIIGQPIDPNLPVPPVLNEIFDYDTAEPGEEVKIYTTEDTNAGDTITAVSTDGHIVNYKIDPQTPAVIPFTSVQSRLERVHVDAILNSPDQSVLARRKAAITRGLDKKIVKETLDLLLAVSSQEVVQGTGMDLYDLVIAMKHKIEDFGDNYILLVGTKVSEAIDVYDKVNATNFNYRIGLVETLKEKGIKVVKVYETAYFNFIDTTATGEPETDNVKVLARDKMILVARDSNIQKGKPGVYIRRKISPAIAQMMGSDVDATFRASSVIPLPVNLSGNNTLAFGIHAFEQRVCALLNYRGIAWATLA
jgi:hypothetical protein